MLRVASAYCALFSNWPGTCSKYIDFVKIVCEGTTTVAVTIHLQKLDGAES